MALVGASVPSAINGSMVLVTVLSRPRRNHVKPMGRAIAATLATILLAAACSGGGGSKQAASSSSEETSAAGNDPAVAVAEKWLDDWDQLDDPTRAALE